MNTTPQVLDEESAMITREDFGGKQIAVTGETSSTAMAAQAKAAIEARYVMALQRPRDWDTVRLKILKDCSRPAFADSAWYRRPVGGGKDAEGFSIRFAEAAMRAMGNLYPETMTIYDDPRKRIVRVVVTDLEDNITYSVDVTVEKTVERKQLKKGQKAFSQRINSYGENVFIVEADEGALTTKQEALVSKAMRKCGLRLLPGDIQDEARAKIFKVRNDKAAQDPDAARRQLMEAFNYFGVTPEMVTAYLGHPTTAMSPKEIVELQSVYMAVKEGSSWASIMEERGESVPETTPVAKTAKPKTLAEVVQKAKAAPPASVVTDPTPEELEAMAIESAPRVVGDDAPMFDADLELRRSLEQQERAGGAK